ncbi:MAG TPA: hypothetical protein VGP99_01700 [Tepidisphaeraceae bacterium]|jgi:hypothetical protein|nr:hypothetical protein [Tepidisphaeraceae bacterium]
MIAQGEANALDSMVRQVKAEPKKAAALALLVAVLVAMWAKIFLFSDPRPVSAGASGGEKVKAVTPYTLNQQLSPASRSLLEWTKKPITGTKRNLFAIKLDYFPVDGSRPMFSGDDADGFWDQLAKSLAAKADQEKAKGILRDNVVMRASRLDLQSTGSFNGIPKAMVNGTIVQEGDMIEGFRVVMIEAKRIVVELEGIQVQVIFKH